MTSRPTVALLLGTAFDYTLTILAATGVARFGVPGDLPESAAPWAFPNVVEGDAVLVGSAWAEAAARAGTDVAGDVIPSLRRRFGRVVGLDQETSFHLQFSDDVMRALDAVIKPNGVYGDPELYSFAAGAQTPDGRWSEKIVALAPRYSREAVAKLHLSVPCFLPLGREVRALARRFHRRSRVSRLARDAGDRVLAAATRPWGRAVPSQTAHFIGALSHVQRADAIRRIRTAGITLVGGIASVPDRVNGFAGFGRSTLDAAQRSAVFERLRVEGLTGAHLGRVGYRLSLRRAKAVVSIAGRGELCFRAAEAFEAGGVLVCQDLSHCRTLYPFVPGRNVVYCRPDLADLTAILDDIECNFGRYRPIAEQGHHDWRTWSASAPDLLRRGFAPILGG